MKAHELENLEELEVAVPPDPIAGAVRKMIAEIGEDPDREGIQKTPARVAKSLRFLTSGYHQDIDKVLNGALYSVAYDEMVIVKDIEIFSMCEHHLLPFFGRCHVAYVPNGKVIGLSKIPRIVDVFARRLQVQERLTVQIAETIMEKIKPQGVGVIIEARHLCMIMRGVEKQNSDCGDFSYARGIPRLRRDALGIPAVAQRKSLKKCREDCVWQAARVLGSWSRNWKFETRKSTLRREFRFSSFYHSHGKT